MTYVYLLQSLQDQDCYIGSTSDLRRRFTEHNAGTVQSTRPRRPFRLVYYEAYTAEHDARVREHNLKLRSNAYRQLKQRLKSSLDLEVWGHGNPPSREEAKIALHELRTLGRKIRSEHE